MDSLCPAPVSSAVISSVPPPIPQRHAQALPVPPGPSRLFHHHAGSLLNAGSSGLLVLGGCACWPV